MSYSEQNAFSAEPEAASPLSLLASGLQCARQGRYVEAVASLTQARESLSPDWTQLFTLLEAFIQGHTIYWEAQQALHQASKRFAEIDAQQQAHLAALEALLAAQTPEANRASQAQTIVQSPTGSPIYQAPSLPRPSSQDDRAYQPLQSAKPSSIDARGDQPLSSLQAVPGEGNRFSTLYATCFGHFEVRRFDQSIVLCPNQNGQVILRYLLAQSKHYAQADVLMDLLWPDDVADVARHKLQVAVSTLRRSLNGGRISDPDHSYIIYKNQGYQLNPALPLLTDVDKFLALYQAGCQASRGAGVTYYEQACQLYTGPFLIDDLYADWSMLQREHLSKTYLVMCRTIAEYYLEIRCYSKVEEWAGRLLEESPCDEDAHQLLMRGYASEGRRNEALRQYQRCQQILFKELAMQPMPETVALFQAIVNGEKLPQIEPR